MPRLIPADRPDLPPRVISERLRSQLMYFAAAPEVSGNAPTAENEYRFDADEVASRLSDGVFYVVSPLDTANQTEVELTEEQESLLEWLASQAVGRVVVED